MAIDPQRIQALCFDVDGTLRDTDDQYVLRLTKFFNRIRWLHRRTDPTHTARRIVMTLDTPINAVYTMLDWVGLDAPVIRLLEKMNELELRKSKASLPLIPGAKAALESLSQKFPLAVVSARGAQGTQEFLDYHNLNGLFKCVASGQTTPHTKPWPDPILWSAQQMGVPPDSCLMIGDTTVDIRAGRAANCQTVGVLSGFGDKRELSRAGADLLLDSVADLENILL